MCAHRCMVALLQHTVYAFQCPGKHVARWLFRPYLAREAASSRYTHFNDPKDQQMTIRSRNRRDVRNDCSDMDCRKGISSLQRSK